MSLFPNKLLKQQGNTKKFYIGLQNFIDERLPFLINIYMTGLVTEKLVLLYFNNSDIYNLEYKPW